MTSPRPDSVATSATADRRAALTHDPRDAPVRSMLRPVDLLGPVEGQSSKRGGQAFLSVVLQGGLRFLTSFFVGRFTNPATLALVSSGMSLANLLALTWPTSEGAAASRFIARSRGEGSDVNALAAFMGRRTLQAVLILSVGSVPIWVYLGGSLTEGAVVALLVATFSGYSFTRGLHYGSGQTSRQLKWDVVTSSIAVTGVLVVLLAQLPAILVLGVLGISYGIYTIACWPWRAGGRVAPATRREVDAFVAWGALGTLASAGFVQFAMIFAVAIAGREEAGQFAAAMVLAAPAAMVANAMAQILFPSMAEALGRGDRASVQRQLDQSTKVLAAIMVLIFGAVVIGCRPLIEVVWGSRYSAAAVIIPLLLIPAMLRSIASPSQGAISVSTRGGIVFSSVASVGGFVVGAVVWALMPSSWGVVGVAAGYALGTSLIAVAIFVRAWSRHEQSWLETSAVVVVAGAVMGCASWQLSMHSPHMIVDLCAVATFVVVWSAVQWRQLTKVWTLVGRRG